MSIFFRELRAHKKSLFFWCLGMVFLVYSSMVKYANLKATGQSIDALMSQFPKTVKIIFGLNGFDLSTVSGYFGVTFLYIALAATLYAILLGTEIVSKEERDKTSEFIFVKPQSRRDILWQKLAASILLVLILNIVTTIASVYSVGKYNSGASITNLVLELMGGLLCLQLVFLCIGIACAATISKAKKASSIATAILLITFILPFLINFNDKLLFLKSLSPYMYFDAKTIIDEGRLSMPYVLFSFVICTALITLALFVFKKRDLAV